MKELPIIFAMIELVSGAWKFPWSNETMLTSHIISPTIRPDIFTVTIETSTL